MRGPVYAILIGTYHTDLPHDHRTARTLTAARAWLRGRGYKERKTVFVRGERAYFEHPGEELWARVVAAPDVED